MSSKARARTRVGAEAKARAAAGAAGAAGVTSSTDQQVLARVLKDAMKSGKYTIGTKEVISELKSAKMVIAASTHSSDGSEKSLAREAEKNNVPIVKIEKSSAELGKMLGRPFRISAVAVRVVAEGDYRQLLGSGQSGAPAAPVAAAATATAPAQQQQQQQQAKAK
jgi:large subunit ribosomal protein L30e